MNHDSSIQIPTFVKQIDFEIFWKIVLSKNKKIPKNCDFFQLANMKAAGGVKLHRRKWRKSNFESAAEFATEKIL